MPGASSPRRAAPCRAARRGAARRGTPAPLIRLVEQLLGEDERFAPDGAGNWGLAGWERETETLAGVGKEPGRGANRLAGVGQGPGGAPYAVVDVETTGGRTETHRILEVAVVCLDGGQVSQHYTSLVNPLCPVPAVVTELTGITQEMVEEAPTADAVLAEVRAATGDRVLVGHNLGADLTFLNYEALWHDLSPFGNPALDTEALAQRLLPDLRRPSLTRVAAALGLTPPLRHRALPDARLTAAVLLTLLRRLPEIDGGQIGTVGDLLAWLAGPLSERQARVRRVTGRGAGHLPSGTIRALPDSPGVYTFRDGAGEALYVGKAGSLRHRVMQHFSGTARALRRHDGLLERTAAVEHEVVGCELDALLLESARIRSLRPRYNVQARSQPGCPFLRFEAGPFPRAGATRSSRRWIGRRRPLPHHAARPPHPGDPAPGVPDPLLPAPPPGHPGPDAGALPAPGAGALPGPLRRGGQP